MRAKLGERNALALEASHYDAKSEELRGSHDTERVERTAAKRADATGALEAHDAAIARAFGDYDALRAASCRGCAETLLGVLEELWAAAD